MKLMTKQKEKKFTTDSKSMDFLTNRLNVIFVLKLINSELFKLSFNVNGIKLYYSFEIVCSHLRQILLIRINFEFPVQLCQ